MTSYNKGKDNPMFGLKGYWFGKKMSKGTKEKISEAHKGKSLSEKGHKSNCQCCCCKVKRGEFKHSEKTKREMSEKHSGKNNPMWGKHHSEKVREKIRQASPRIAREKAGNWKGGITKHSSGYILILKPDHPYSQKNGYVKRSRLVMEKHLGRYLEAGEIPHHKNEIRDDDRIENLRLFPSKNKHTSFHNEIRKKLKEEARA